LLERGIGGGLPGANFELQLALGLAALERGAWAGALRNLTLAAEADPFRAHLAWRALSWLAEITGHEEEARQWIARALESNPGDAWSLYQRGRLLLLADDEQGAQESFEAALEQAVGFADVLAGLGDLAQRAGRHEDAERYLARAAELDPNPAHLHARRGVNFLAMGETQAAREAFSEALRREDVPSATAGLGWCSYVEGDSLEATTLLSDLADRRRSEAGDDPWRLWSEGQIARILDHDSKEVWVDRFDRRSGDPAGGWMLELGHGPDVRLVDGEVVIEGQLTSSGRTRFWRPIASTDLVSFELSVDIDPTSQAQVGVFLSLERKGGAVESSVRASASISRNKDGGVQLRTIQSGNRDAPYEDVPGASWPAGRPLSVIIERSGEGNESDLIFYLGGIPVIEGLRVAALGSSTAELKLGVFVEGNPGRPVRVKVDDVEVVRRRRR
jgi:Tfp pilus assembly protein PilF